MPDDLANEEAITRVVSQRRLRRVPVYGETPDEIEGVLDVSAFLRDPESFTTRSGSDVPSFVPGTMKAVTLLKSFLSHPQGMALVVDEHGGIEGVVTLSRSRRGDHQRRGAAGGGEALHRSRPADGRLLANGNARLEDIAEELGISL